jgi:gliding motility-associated-like protein
MMVRRTDITLFLWALGVMWAMCIGVSVKGQPIFNQTQPPSVLVQGVLVDPSVFTFNVQFNGQVGSVMPTPESSAERIARFNASNTNLGIASGVMLTNSTTQSAMGPNNDPDFDAGNPTLIGDPDLHVLTGYIYPFSVIPDYTRDIAILEFDFIPTSDMVSFRYVFASEEYPYGSCANNKNDVFGCFLSGPGIVGPFQNNAINLALVPGSLAPISINTVNSGMVGENANGGNALDPFEYCFAADSGWVDNHVYFRTNGNGSPNSQPYCCDPQYLQYNGMTTVLVASAAVRCGEQYHLKIGIADTHSHYGPSAVFLEQGSFTSTDRFDMDVLPGENVEFNATDTTFIESECDSVYLRFHRRGGFYLDEYLRITTSGSATEDVDYVSALPDSIHFAQFDSTVVVVIAVPVDADGVEDLRVTLVTCDGLKLQHYDYLIDQREPLMVVLDDVQLTCPETVTLTPTVTGGGGDPAAYTYLWNTGATTPSITVDIVESTQFWVTVGDCWATQVTDSAWVYLPEQTPLVVSLPPEVQIPCSSSDELVPIISGALGAVSYVWFQGDNEVGTTPTLSVPAANDVEYVVVVTDACQRTQSASVVITTGPTPPIVLSAIGDTVDCAGMEAVLQVLSISGGGGAYRFDWGLGVNPEQDNQQQVTVIAGGTTSYHTLMITDQCGNVADTTLAIVVPDLPSLVITATGDTVVCPGTAVLLQAQVSGGAGDYTVEWLGLGSGNTATWIAEEPGLEAVVQAIDGCGQMVEQVISVGVHQVSGNIQADQLDDQTWEFEAITDPSEGNMIEWDLGDGNTAIGDTVTHTYGTSEAAWVLMFVTTEEGCVVVDSVQTTPPSATIYFPNAFSPNGDHINDTFGGEGTLLDRYELYVFDRWGGIIFQSMDMAVRWDGTLDGEEVMNGVYPFKYVVKGLKMSLKQGFGHIVLIR